MREPRFALDHVIQKVCHRKILPNLMEEIWNQTGIFTLNHSPCDARWDASIRKTKKQRQQPSTKLGLKLQRQTPSAWHVWLKEEQIFSPGVLAFCSPLRLSDVACSVRRQDCGEMSVYHSRILPVELAKNYSYSSDLSSSNKLLKCSCGIWTTGSPWFLQLSLFSAKAPCPALLIHSATCSKPRCQQLQLMSSIFRRDLEI